MEFGSECAAWVGESVEFAWAVNAVNAVDRGVGTLACSRTGIVFVVFGEVGFGAVGAGWFGFLASHDLMAKLLAVVALGGVV